MKIRDWVNPTSLRFKDSSHIAPFGNKNAVDYVMIDEPRRLIAHITHKALAKGAARPGVPLETSLQSHSDKPHRVPVTQFFLALCAQFALATVAFRYISPVTFGNEIAHPWMVVLWTALLGVPLSLFEYLYHRYLLHSAVLPFMGSMHRAHGNHHGLTYVKAPVRADAPATLVPVKSEFPVVHEHQEESMMFPLYSLSIFIAVFLLIIALPLKLIFSQQPIIISLMIAVTLYYAWYEMWHAIMHLPYDRFWKGLMASKRWGRLVRFIYGFHLMHHWRPSSNLAVVGFWGFATWDHLFRTHRRPKNVPLQGAEVNFTDASLMTPRWPISLLDRWQVGCFKWSRKVEKSLLAIFVRKTARTSDK